MTFIEKISKSIIVSKSEIEVQVLQMTKEIIKNEQVGNRTTEQLVRDIASGVILETALAKAIGGKVNMLEFNKSDPKTFAYDVSLGEITFEVKSSPDNKWFNFNVYGNENDSERELKRVNLSTFLKYSRWVDYLVVGVHTKISDDSFEVRFKWLIEASTFERYMSKSNGKNAGTSNYYNVIKAERNGHCYILS